MCMRVSCRASPPLTLTTLRIVPAGCYAKAACNHCVCCPAAVLCVLQGFTAIAIVDPATNQVSPDCELQLIGKDGEL
jgi:hypothetical protein